MRLELPRPREIMQHYEKLFPMGYKCVAELREEIIKRRPDLTWSKYCYIPVGYVSNFLKFPRNPETLQLIPGFVALASWRYSQGIYRFDPDIFEPLWHTDLQGDIPAELLYQLPEWCVYIETPGKTYQGMPLYGFFAHIDAATAMFGDNQLRILLDLNEAEHQRFELIILDIGQFSVIESIERASRPKEQWHNSHFRTMIVNPMSPSGLSDAVIKAKAEAIMPLLSLLLYLATSNADYSELRPAYPKPVKTKKGMKLFPPDKPKQWDVGVRIGAALRRAYHEQAVPEGTIPTGRTVRPHIRGAHYHAFWNGPRSQPAERRLELKWLPPIPIKIADLDNQPTVIHPVHE